MNDVVKAQLNQKLIEAGLEYRFWVDLTENAFPKEKWVEIFSRDDADIDKQDLLYYAKKIRLAARKYDLIKKQIEDSQ